MKLLFSHVYSLYRAKSFKVYKEIPLGCILLASHFFTPALRLTRSILTLSHSTEE